MSGLAYGPRTAAGEDTYVLCEINVSSVFPIPDDAPGAIANLVESRLIENGCGRVEPYGATRSGGKLHK